MLQSKRLQRVRRDLATEQQRGKERKEGRINERGKNIHHSPHCPPRSGHVISQDISQVVFSHKILPKERHRTLIVSKYSSLRKGLEVVNSFTICKQNRLIKPSKY